jgi:xanthine dehydrogenase small subunit
MTIRFRLNGRAVEAAGLPPTTTLLNFLRDHLRATGTKEGCAEGDCGACTVAVLDADGPRWRAVDSCLVLLPQVDGLEIVTAEGLPADHAVPKAIVDRLASQCGYCTPGVAMSLFEATYRDDLTADWKLADQLCGNLCRCTGYRPIQEAAREVGGSCPADTFAQRLQEPIPAPAAVDYNGGDAVFVAPTTLQGVFDALDAHPGAKLIAGATDLGLDVNKKHATWPALIGLDRVSELRQLGGHGGPPHELSIGAATPLADIEAWAQEAFPPLARMLRYFGSRQIKHRATIGGNLVTASPIGDTAPVLLAMDAVVVAASRAGERRIPIASFFPSYRKTALQPGEVLARIEVPRWPDDARIGVYKVSRRREMDISAVSGAFFVHAPDGVVTAARFGFGGMAATPKRASALEGALIGQPWTEDAVLAALPALDQDFAPMDDHRGSAWYRRTVAKNLVRGFFAETRGAPFRALPDRPLATLVGEEV